MFVIPQDLPGGETSHNEASEQQLETDNKTFLRCESYPGWGARPPAGARGSWWRATVWASTVTSWRAEWLQEPALTCLSDRPCSCSMMDRKEFLEVWTSCLVLSCCGKRCCWEKKNSIRTQGRQEEHIPGTWVQSGACRNFVLLCTVPLFSSGSVSHAHKQV